MSERTFKELAEENERCVQPDRLLRRCFSEIASLLADRECSWTQVTALRAALAMAPEQTTDTDPEERLP